MEADVDQKFIGEVMRDRRAMTPLLSRAAQPVAQRLRAITFKRTGGTAASVEVRTGYMNARRDRVAVRVTQRRGAVPMNFPRRSAKHRAYMRRAL